MLDRRWYSRELRGVEVVVHLIPLAIGQIDALLARRRRQRVEERLLARTEFKDSLYAAACRPDAANEVVVADVERPIGPGRHAHNAEQGAAAHAGAVGLLAGKVALRARAQADRWRCRCVRGAIRPRQ